MYDNCFECMKDAPYHFCCKKECGEHEFCRGCNVKSRGIHCPNEMKGAEGGVIPAHWGDLFRAECDGRLVVLPCKVGDTVYTFYNGKNCKWPTNMKRRKIYETLVSGIRLHDWSDDWSALLFFDTKEMTGDYEFSFDEFGKTIFQTRAEAEAAMKGVSEDA